MMIIYMRACCQGPAALDTSRAGDTLTLGRFAPDHLGLAADADRLMFAHLEHRGTVRLSNQPVVPQPLALRILG